MPASRKPARSGLVLLLLSGTLTSLLSKVLYTLKAPGRDGKMRFFAKPYFSSLLMFVGMALCLPFAWLFHAVAARLQQRKLGAAGATNLSDAEEPLLRETDSRVSLSTIAEEAKKWWEHYDVVLFPMLFDLTATVLMSVGLLFTTVSTYQMVRGTEIIFTALLSALVLHRRLGRDTLIGLVLCTLGIGLVGYSSMLSAGGREESKNLALSSLPAPALADPSGDPTAAQTLLGMGLIVLAEAVQASQVVTEDYLMSAAPSKISPLEVVGYEGLFGVVAMCGVVLPLLQASRLGAEGGGLREDTLGSLHMLAHSRALAQAAALFVAGMSIYNVSGMWVTDSLGALSRTVAETMRTLLVWLLDLWLYYHTRSKVAKMGEPWTTHSWLQALGFAVLVAGALVYSYGEEEQAKALHEGLEQRARARWARLRHTVPDLVRSGRLELLAGEGGAPCHGSRISSPSRIRIAYRALQAADRFRRGAAGRAPASPGDGAARQGAASGP